MLVGRSTMRSGRWRWSRRATSRAGAARRPCRPGSKGDATAHRCAPAFLALRRRGVRVDRRGHGGAPPRFPSGRCARRDGCGRHRRLCRGAGAADAGGDAVAAGARRSSTRSSPAWWVGSICGRRTSRHRFAACATHPKLVGVRHIVQAEPDGFLSGAAFRRGIECLEAARACRTTSSSMRVSCQRPSTSPRVSRTVASCSIISASRIFELVRSMRGMPMLNRWRRSRTSVAKLSGLVTEAHWHEWTPSELGRYVDAAFDCFGADRLMIGSDWPVCTLSAGYRATMDVVAGQPRAAVLSASARPSWAAPPGDSGI